MSENVLVVAVHPDDETLGCGGTLLRHSAAGDHVHWLLVTALREADGWPAERLRERRKTVAAVAAAYGMAGVHDLGFPAMGLDRVPVGELVAAIGGVVNAVQPRTVYLPFRGDVHSDHRVAFAAAHSCTKSFRYPSVARVLMMETLSETDFAPALPDMAFIPNFFVDITATLAAKLKMLGLYAGEMGTHPFPRNERAVEALAVTRGVAAGCEYAEAFMLLKEIKR